MITITAVIRTKSGREVTMRDALLDVAAHVAAREPDTIGFFISQSEEDPCLFTTYERFANKAAMDRHNGSAAVATFFGIAKPILDGEVMLVTSKEVSATVR
ncbi:MULTISPECIES: putative quinol monooxygenase [unclassified Bradyrhizobium]|jgi:quinol monooxygenase YgiN|uniref:putative quinol monooxygenase n=1 Tax=unclassified Bradyrhizobium TaxID=2631580 RepID=UPI00040EAD0F|nr:MULTISPECIES: antibiotic biosynthesis monooxygenase [unclassified Bradyrhizobium]MCK7671592.1 antibiotic biosynthesis monooxygenase [Bradyrhizobium sp. 2S1]